MESAVAIATPFWNGDPTLRIVICCEFGKISTLAASTLRGLGFMRATALDGGLKTWREAGYGLDTSR